MDWGYVYDRNGGGRVDYVVFLYGPMALTPANPPPGFSATADQVDREGLLLWLKSSRLFFFHGADDDFNGTADLMVGPSGPAPRGVWFDSFAALKSTARNGKVDDAWSFRDSIDVRLGPPAVASKVACPQTVRPWRAAAMIAIVHVKACLASEGCLFGNFLRAGISLQIYPPESPFTWRPVFGCGSGGRPCQQYGC